MGHRGRDAVSKNKGQLLKCYGLRIRRLPKSFALPSGWVRFAYPDSGYPKDTQRISKAKEYIPNRQILCNGLTIKSNSLLIINQLQRCDEKSGFILWK